jgi:hypothetical protein
MSWGNRYPLPWTSLDLSKVRAAAGAVAAALGGVRQEVVQQDSDLIICFFDVPLKEARRWAKKHDDGEFDQRLRQQGEAGSASLPIEIEFRRYRGAPGHGLGPFCEFSFDTADSANWLGSGAAVEIAERLGNHFGVGCEPN